MNENMSRAEKEKRLKELLSIPEVNQGLLVGMAPPLYMRQISEAKRLLQELGRI